MAINESSVSSEELVINAPAQLVWDIILDFENYHQWNKFCPEIKGTPELGSALHMQVDLGNGLQEQVEHVTKLDVDTFTVVWSMENKPGDPIHADRTQRVIPIDQNSCRYWTIDEFAGDAVKPMIDALGAQVERGFALCADGLKAYAETMFNHP